MLNTVLTTSVTSTYPSQSTTYAADSIKHKTQNQSTHYRQSCIHSYHAFFHACLPNHIHQPIPPHSTHSIHLSTSPSQISGARASLELAWSKVDTSLRAKELASWTSHHEVNMRQEHIKYQSSETETK
jgi:hypothetical protein